MWAAPNAWPPPPSGQRWSYVMVAVCSPAAPPPRDCEAHHIIPWRLGGPTALWNLVLLCAHHHGTVEPSHDPQADRWKIRLREDGIAEIIPPLRVDPSQRPRLHARFHTR